MLCFVSGVFVIVKPFEKSPGSQMSLRYFNSWTQTVLCHTQIHTKCKCVGKIKVTIFNSQNLCQKYNCIKTKMKSFLKGKGRFYVQLFSARASISLLFILQNPSSVMWYNFHNIYHLNIQASLQALLQPSAIEFFEAIRSLFLQVCMHVKSETIIKTWTKIKCPLKKGKGMQSHNEMLLSKHHFFYHIAIVSHIWYSNSLKWYDNMRFFQIYCVN